MSQTASRRGGGARALALGVAGLALAGCSAGGAPSAASLAAADQVAPSTVGGAAAELPRFAGRLRPDVLVSGRLTDAELGRLTALHAAAVPFLTGTVRVGKAAVHVVAVDAAGFRRYAPAGTAESDQLWRAVAGGQLVASHAVARRLHLPLGQDVTLTGRSGPVGLRVGGFATTNVPAADVVVSRAIGEALGLGATRAVLLHGGKVDPAALAARARKAAGTGADVDLLAPPAANPVAFLTGSRAARAFGAFSYRYFPDGTIQPDARWVRASITTERVPLLGYVTCHRLMLPQLRAALQEVADAGLGSRVHSFDGCYVPRFIERNPSQPVSLHTWGIAIDIDAASNGRGSRGTMDPRVVRIFKRWGFRWGGDWAWSDPMHFELGALLKA